MNSKISSQTMSPTKFEQELRHSGITKRTAHSYRRIIETTIEEHGKVTLEIASDVVYNTFDTFSAAAANRKSSAFKAYSKVCGLGWEDQIRRYKETPAPKRQPDIEVARQIIEVEPEDTRDPLVHNKYSLLFELMFLTGMRLCEARKLQVVDVSQHEIILNRTKSGAGRRVATPPFKQFQKRLFDHVDALDSKWLFPKEQYKEFHLGDAACRKEFSNRLKRLGITYKYTPHTFRGAFMTRNLRNGAVLFDVQDIVGHKNANTTQIYYRGGIESQRELMRNDPANLMSLGNQERLEKVVKDIKKAIGDSKNLKVEIKESGSKFELLICIDE